MLSLSASIKWPPLKLKNLETWVVLVRRAKNGALLRRLLSLAACVKQTILILQQYVTFYSDFLSRTLKANLGQMHIYTPFCLFVAARILAERVQFQPSISEYRHALMFLRQVLERLKKTNPLAEIFLVQLRLAERAKEQREDGNNDSQDKAQGDLRSSLSFTHSFQYVPDLISLSPHE
jgi:hypothetical protein